ncbi:hypothetical protein OH77DRAFT_74006 [Trametes cingulata]|nr:hypothetical protein OH77DRAFT_74006 [Trametes cingulata]
MVQRDTHTGQLGSQCMDQRSTDSDRGRAPRRPKTSARFHRTCSNPPPWPGLQSPELANRNAREKRACTKRSRNKRAAPHAHHLIAGVLHSP